MHPKANLLDSQKHLVETSINLFIQNKANNWPYKRYTNICMFEFIKACKTAQRPGQQDSVYAAQINSDLVRSVGFTESL